MKNKLDPFAERLDEWKSEGKTLAQMQSALREDGCAVALSSLSEFLTRRNEQRMRDRLFENIASGRQMNQELDTAYENNPEPGLARLMKVSQTLIASLQVHGTAEPKLLVLANSMLQTVLDYFSGMTKAELEKRKLEQGDRRIAALESKVQKAREELRKLSDPKAQSSEEERKAIVDKVDEVLGLK